MKKYVLSLSLLALIAVLVASCLKDRLVKTTPPPPVNTGSDTLIYYWNCDVDSSVILNSPTVDIVGAGANLFYGGASYDTVQPGGTVNAVGIYTVLTSSSAALRLRNPASGPFILTLPTTGYKNIVLKYAVQRTSKGSQTNTVSYTTDGVNYVNTAIANYATYSVDTVDTNPTAFQLVSYDFSSDPAVNNNPNFKVQIVFSTGSTNTSGNDRYDNITVYGVKE